MFKILDADPGRHRAVIGRRFTSPSASSRWRADKVSADLVREEGARSSILCRGLTDQGAGKLSASLGPEITVNVSRGDGRIDAVARMAMERAGFFNG